MSPLPPGHPTGLVFMDETRDDIYFGVGCLKLREPHKILEEFAALRAEYKFWGKLRWADVGGYSQPYLEFAERAASMVAAHPTAEFACTLLDLKAVGGIQNYGSIGQAYVRLASQALVAVTEEHDELISVIGDHFDAPAGFEIERPIRNRVNQSMERLAAVSIQRVTSSGTDGLQLADLMLGAIAHEFRAVRREGADPGKAALALGLLTNGYDLTAYHDAEGGRSIPRRLTIELLPRPNRRGRRGGRRA
jgi:hypothetical protein